QQALHPRPRHTVVTVSPVQPVSPLPYDSPSKLFQAAQIARDSVVAEMALQFQSQLLHLHGEFLMSIVPAPFVDSFQCPIQSLARSLAHHGPSTFPAFPPIVGEPQKIESPGWLLSSDTD